MSLLLDAETLAELGYALPDADALDMALDSRREAKLAYMRAYSAQWRRTEHAKALRRAREATEEFRAKRRKPATRTRRGQGSTNDTKPGPEVGPGNKRRTGGEP